MCIDQSTDSHKIVRYFEIYYVDITDTIYIFLQTYLYNWVSKLRLIQLSTPISHHTCSLVGTLRTSSYFCSSRINVNLGDISIARISVPGPFIPSCKWSKTPLQRKPQGRASLWIGSQVSVNLCTSTRPGHKFCAIYLISCLDHLSFVRSFLDIQRRGKSVVTINESITAKLRMTSLVGIHVDVSTFSFFNQPMSNSLNPTSQGSVPIFTKILVFCQPLCCRDTSRVWRYRSVGMAIVSL